MSPSADEHPVRIARLALNWDLKDLARECGRSAGLLSMVEKGYVPKLRTRWKIARGLKADIAVLWPDEENPPIEETP